MKVLYLGMYLTDLTFLDLGRKKNGSLSTPTTPVSKFADYNKRTPPITSIQAQVRLFIVYTLSRWLSISD